MKCLCPLHSPPTPTPLRPLLTLFIIPRECGGELNSAHRAWQLNKRQKTKQQIGSEQRRRNEHTGLRWGSGDEFGDVKKIPLDRLKF